MHSFTQNPRLALPSAIDDRVEEAIIDDNESQVLDVDTTALPGALEVYLIRATDIVQVCYTFRAIETCCRFDMCSRLRIALLSNAETLVQ